MSIYKLFPLFMVLSESETLFFMLIAFHAFFRIINFHWCIYILHFFLVKLMAISITSTFCCFLNQITVTIHTKLFVCSSFFFSVIYFVAVNKTKKKREALCKSPTGTEEMAQWLVNTYSSRNNPSLNASMLKEHGPLFSPTQLAYTRIITQKLY